MSNPNDRHLKAVPPPKPPRERQSAGSIFWMVVLGLALLIPLIWGFRWALGLL